MADQYLNAPIRARMYATTKHKVIWVVAVLASAGLVTPILFFIAAKKGVTNFIPAIVYAAITWGSTLGNTAVFGDSNWIGGVLAITMIVGAAHAALLDHDWKPAR
ncbi:hypothetical protein [Streptomyces sp. NPDC052225]|uniref:hypothetical protein n=1 Tax=Streptomyces sp. NPDC052225 TaxID=3154949 RepID=UPI00343DF986